MSTRRSLLYTISGRHLVLVIRESGVVLFSPVLSLARVIHHFNERTHTPVSSFRSFCSPMITSPCFPPDFTTTGRSGVSSKKRVHDIALAKPFTMRGDSSPRAGSSIHLNLSSYEEDGEQDK